MFERNLRSDPAIATLTADILPFIVESKGCNTESIRYFRLMMNVRERWQDRVRLFSRLAFTSTAGEWSAMRLPARLFPLYRLVRMCRLAGKLF
jgi:hypothetical protein